jgi:hypothetical protein
MYFPILAPNVVSNVISQQAATSSWLLNLFGVNHGGTAQDPLFEPDTDVAKGENVMFLGHGRNGAFNIVDNSRKVAKGTAPGAPASKSSIAVIGSQPFTYPRMHDSIRLLAETFHNLGMIENPAQRDLMGRRMIEVQTKVKAQEAANWRKAALIGALRNTLRAVKDGEDWNWSYTSGMVVSAQIPAGNTLQLNMLGAGNIVGTTWANAAAPITSNLGSINAGFQQLCGGALRGIICSNAVWQNVIRNTAVREVAGLSSAPFETLTFEGSPKLASTMKNVKMAKLISDPQLTFYVTDEVVELGDGTSQKICPDTQAIFLGFTPDDGTIAMYEGSEPIAEYDGGPMTQRSGFSSWVVPKSNPTATEVFFLDNAMPVIHVPNAVAIGTVVF